MPVIEWSDQYSVKITDLDTQHEKVIETFNSIYDAIESIHDEEIVFKELDKLLDHWNIHFKIEEDLMKKHDYPNYSNHRTEHNDVLNKILNIKTIYSNGEKYFLTCLLAILHQWVTEHIAGEDKKLGEYLNSKNVA